MNTLSKQKIIFPLLSVLFSCICFCLVDVLLGVVLHDDLVNPVPLIRGLEFETTCEALARGEPTIGLAFSPQFSHFPPVDYFTEDYRDPGSLYKNNPDFFWSIKPESRIECQVPYVDQELARKLTYTIKTNKRGLRGADFKTKKAAGEFRIICLGDSRTFGWGIAEEDTFGQQLASLIQQKTQQRVQVINAGVPGYTSFQGLLFAQQEIVTWEPDIVVCWYGCNDNWPCHETDEQLYHRRKAVPGMRRFIRRSTIYTLLAQVKFLFIDTRRGYWQKTMTRRRVPASDFIRNGLKIAQLFKNEGSPTLFISLGEGPEYRAALEKIGVVGGIPVIDAERVFVREQRLLRRGEHYIEKYSDLQRLLGPKLLQEYPALDLFVDPSHPNQIGHLILAEVLQKEISGLIH